VKDWRIPRRAILPLLLVLATVVTYLPALGSGYVWDDDSHVTDNPTLRSLDGLRRIWTELGATPQYYPLVHTTFWLEHRLFGLAPLGYHLTNLLLHALNGLLAAAVLRRLRVPGAWLAAFVFTLHPVQVESVAWISERKNVLSGAFYLAAALAFLRYAPPDAEPGERGSRRSWLAFVGLFAAALLSKTVTATLPAALLLVRFWKRGRVVRSDVTPLLVPFAMGIVAGLLTVWVELHHVGAVGESWDLGPVGRVLVAGRALWFYLAKLAWPSGLSFIYPRWEIDPSSAWQYLFPVTFALGLGGLFLARARIGRGPVVAVLYFAVTLLPALGFFNVYPFRFSFVADHFQYLACIGPIALAVAWAVSATGRAAPAVRRLAAVAGVGALALLGLASWQRTHAFADAETLWRDTLDRNPAAWMAHTNLGVLLDRSGRTAEAYRHYALAVRLKPDYSEGWSNLGAAADRLGRRDEAIDDLKTALRLDPTDADAAMNLANVLYSSGRISEAIDAYRRVVAIRPDHAAARNNLGVLLAERGQLTEAAGQLEAAVAARPGFAKAWTTLGETYQRLGRLDDAESAYRHAMAAGAATADLHVRLAAVLEARGLLEAAAQECRAALALDPGNRDALEDLRRLSPPGS
jgi:tetratricopeptide (TPR) repeat protein